MATYYRNGVKRKGNKIGMGLTGKLSFTLFIADFCRRRFSAFFAVCGGNTRPRNAAKLPCAVNRTARVYIVCLYLTNHFCFICILWRLLQCQRKRLRRLSAITARVLLEINLLSPPGAVLQSTGKAMGAGQWKYHRNDTEVWMTTMI